MKIITLNGERHIVKYLQHKENIKFKLNTSSHDYPNFNGSQIQHNSSSSDIFSFTFAIHITKLQKLKEDLKLFLTTDDDAILDPQKVYDGKLKNIIVEHNIWGALKGKFLDEISVDTSSQADVICTGIFQIQTDDNNSKKVDNEVENSAANDSLDSATSEGELDEFDKPALLQMLDKFNELYDNIQNSAVIAALNDLESAINEAVLNYQKVMNAVKKVLSLPNNIFNNVSGKLDFFKKQAEAIKAIPRNTFNMTRFNIRMLALNLGFSNRTPFVSKAAERARSGIKTAPIE